jgi:hypothetical protein
VAIVAFSFPISYWTGWGWVQHVSSASAWIGISLGQALRYGSQQALISIDGPALLEGWLSPRVLGLVVEWATLHKEDLTENWLLARKPTSA